MISNSLVMSGSSELSSTVGIIITASCIITFRSIGSSLPVLKVGDSSGSQAPTEIVVSIASSSRSFNNHVLVEGRFDCPAWKQKVKLDGSNSIIDNFDSECRSSGSGSRLADVGSYELVIKTKESSSSSSGDGKKNTVLIIGIVVAAVVVVVVVVVLVVLGVNGKLCCKKNVESA